MARISLDEIKDHVKAASDQYGVPEEHIWNVIRAENSGSVEGARKLSSADPSAISPKGARGIMQVTPVAYKDVVQAGLVPGGLDLANLSVAQQINIGTAYLSRLTKLSDKPEEIYAMYNYGPKARFRMDQLPKETSDYVGKATQRTVTSSTTTSRSPTVPPTDLAAALLGTNAQANDDIMKSMELINTLNEKSNAQAQAAIAAQRSILDAGLQIKNSQFEIQYQNEIAAQQLKQMFGMDPDQLGNELSSSLSEMGAAQRDYGPARAKFDQLSQTSLMDDPIGFIFAQLELPQAAAAVNAQVDREERAAGNIRTRLELLKASTSTITANTHDELLEINKNIAANEVALAKSRLAAEESKVASQQAAQEMQRLQAANLVADNNRATLQVIATLEDREEQRKLRKEQLDEILSRKQEDTEEEARLNSRLAIVSKAMGLAEPMTMKRLKAFGNAKTKDAWMKAALNGQFGDNLGESLKFFSPSASRRGMVDGGNVSMLNTADKMEKAIKEYAPVIEAQVFKSTGKKVDSKDALDSAYGIYETMIVDAANNPASKADMGSSIWDKMYTPYKPEFFYFNKQIDVHPKLAGLKTNLMKKTIEKIADSGAQLDGQNLTSDQLQKVINALQIDVTQGAVSPQKAAMDIMVYMSAATAYNRRRNSYEQFALPAVDKYYVTLEMGNGNRKIDLLDFVQLENLMTRRASEGRMRSFSKGGPTSPFKDAYDVWPMSPGLAGE